MFSAVITTIQEPTKETKELVKKLERPLIVIGNKKTPEYNLPGAKFYSLDDQKKLGFQVNNYLPVNSYTRKNIGYLIAMKNKSTAIFDANDDAAPCDGWVKRDIISKSVEAIEYKWTNVLKWFMYDLWPSKFRVARINMLDFALGDIKDGVYPIQYGMVDGDNWAFNESVPLSVRAGNWCLFNGRNTWWFPKAYPLMYLPSYCSSTLAEIWRSFVAQRCLWEMGHQVLFYTGHMFKSGRLSSPEDIEEEIDGYSVDDKILSILSNLSLNGDSCDNMRACYEALIKEYIIPDEEMYLIDAWINDINNLI
jgi:hypothetical protein